MNHHEETVDKNNLPGNGNEQKNTQCPCGIHKLFEAFPALLIENAEPETKRFREFIVWNDNGTYSLMHEVLLTHPSGKIEFARVRNTMQFRSKLQLCRTFGLDIETLISLN